MIHSQNTIIKIITENQRKCISVPELANKYKIRKTTIYTWFQTLKLKPKRRDWEFIKKILKRRDGGIFFWKSEEDRIKKHYKNEPSIRVKQIIEEVNNKVDIV